MMRPIRFLIDGGYRNHIKAKHGSFTLLWLGAVLLAVLVIHFLR